jgi:hypothetical protein
MQTSTKSTLGDLVATVLWAATLWAADANLDRLAGAAPGRDRFPDADALVLKESRTVTLDESGRKTERFYRLVKILTTQGRKTFADPRFSFDEARQKFTVIRARTRMRDGTVVDTPENGVNIVTVRAVAGAPDYASRREGVVSHVGIEMNALLEIEIEIADRKGGRVGIDGVEVFASKVPVLEKTLSVRIPKGMTLKSETAGPGWPEGAGSPPAGSWALKNIPAYPDEPHSPPKAQICPRVLYSSWPSWKTWSARHTTLFDKENVFTLPPDLVGELEKLRPVPAIPKRLAALDSLLWKRVRHVPCPHEGRNLAEPKKTWTRGYGNGPDRALLYYACLCHLGLDVRPVWRPPAHTVLKAEVPLPSVMEALWMVVKAEEREWWIDASRRVRVTGLLPPPGMPGTGVGGAKRLSSEIRGTVTLRRDGSAAVRLVVELSGLANPAIRAWAGEGGIRAHVREKLKALWKAIDIKKWIEVQVTADRTIVSLEAEASGAVVLEGGLAWFSLPESVFLPLVELPQFRRVLPYRFEESMSETIELSVHPPPGWKLAASPSPLSGGIRRAFRVGALAWAKEGGLFLFRKVEIERADVDGPLPKAENKELLEFRSLLSRWKSKAGRTFMFETR